MRKIKFYPTMDELECAYAMLPMPVPVSNDYRLFRTLRLERLVFQTACAHLPELTRQIELGKRLTPCFDALVHDLFQFFYSLDPTRVGEEQLSVFARYVSAPLFDQLQKTTDAAQTQARCRGRAPQAGRAAAGFAQSIRERADVYFPRSESGKDWCLILDEQRRVYRKLWETLRKKKQRYDESPEGSSYKKLSLLTAKTVSKASQLLHLEEKIRQTQESSQRRRSEEIGKTMQSVAQTIRETQESLCAWGEDAGEECLQSYDDVLEDVRQSPLLQRIARYLGPYRQLLRARLNNGYAYDRGERFSIGTGRKLNQVLTSEFRNLAHPAALPIFLHKLSTGRLRQYIRRESVSLGMGDMIVCVDESSSTAEGDKDAWGKAAACVLLEYAMRQHRSAALIRFANRSRIHTDVFSRDAFSMRDIRNAVNAFFGGGTDYETPLREAMRLMKSGIFRRPDIVFITDGICSVEPGFADELHDALAEHHASVIGILLDSGEAFEFSLKPFCKTIYRTSQIPLDRIVSAMIA